MARLVSTERLAWHLNDHDLALIDVRWEPDAPQAGINAYRFGHIPGAVFLDLDVDLSDRSDLSRGRHPLPSPERFAATLARAGIGQDTRVVAYDDKAGSLAARLWWMPPLPQGSALGCAGGSIPVPANGARYGTAGFRGAGGGIHSRIAPDRAP